MSFMDKLCAAENESAMRNIDPWLVTLAGVRGKVGKGVEQISTQLLMDILNVAQHERGKNYRRLSRCMAALGWTAQRMLAPNRRAYLEQVRGYARDARGVRREQQQQTPDQELSDARGQ